MRGKVVLIIVFLILALPCMELPEWAGMYDDASNDFALAPSGPDLAVSLGSGARCLTVLARRRAQDFPLIAAARSIRIFTLQATNFRPLPLDSQRK